MEHKLDFGQSTHKSANVEIESVNDLSGKAMVNAVEEVTSLPSQITHQKSELVTHVDRLLESHSNVFKRMLLSNEQMQTVNAYQLKQREALDTLLDQRNKSFAMFAKASLVYTQRFIEQMLNVTGSSTQAQADAFIKGVQNRFYEALEKHNEEFMNLFEAKSANQKKRSSELQPFLEGQKKMLLENYYADYELMLDRFSAIIRSKVA